MDEAADLASDFVLATNIYQLRGADLEKKSAEDVRKALALTYWSPNNPNSLQYTIKSDGRLPLDWAGFEAAVGRYVASDLKSSELDRLILTGVTDLEVTGFLEKMYVKNLFEPASVAEAANSSMVGLWFKGRLKSLGLSLLIALATYATSVLWDSAPEWFEIVGYGIALGQFILGSIIATIALPFAISKHKRASQPILKLVDGMATLYGELHSDGPISVRHLRLRFEELRDIDAVWPGSLWVLLEDLERRNITSL